MLSRLLKSFSKKYKVLIILLSFILISFLFEFSYASYFLIDFHANWLTQDQDVIITGAYSLSKDGYYLNDFLTSQMIELYPSKAFNLLSFFNDLINNMFLSVFILTLFFKTIFVFSTFLLSRYLLKNTKLALLATFMLSFIHSMGPEVVGVSSILAKDIVFAFMPLVFYLFLRYHKKLSIPIFIVLGILLNFHSVTIIPIMILFLFSLFFQKKDYKTFFICLIISSLFLFQYYSSSKLKNEEFYIQIHWDPGYLFPTSVGKSILKFACVLIPGFFIIKRKNKELFQWLLIILLYSSLSIFSYFNSEMLLMQFLRSAKYILYFSFIYCTLLISSLWNKSKILGLMLFILIFIPFSSLYYSTVLEGITKSKSIYIEENPKVIQLGEWLDKNTPKDSTLLVPPYWIEIKIWSKRSVVSLWNDASWCAYSKRISESCKERHDDVMQLYSQNQASTAEFLNIANKYNAQYIVTYNKSLDLPKIFSVNGFKVYGV